MEIKIISENKRDFMDLLLLADEQEDMIDKYLDRGSLFALYDNDLKSICVVTDEGDGNFELQNLATYEQFQGEGYGTYLVKHLFEYYKGKGAIMHVGTGDVPSIVSFYEHCGFTFSHRLENYFLEHYIEPMFEEGIQLKDKVYFRKTL
ncbi:MAG: GNAT family N-acetyltransferase [Eggerthellaceae bacterium]|jgi:GNAT superfamily N-acetyltransferase|nr:GNAT family N-acetyltransferase [Eggerthellaceae bacterium]MDR2722001.1 GNAT family N-acetyltransferase [Coriobacteriaceae bacterium]